MEQITLVGNNVSSTAKSVCDTKRIFGQLPASTIDTTGQITKSKVQTYTPEFIYRVVASAAQL